MSKYCIFCGEKPKEKSREHVIPQWLIELTGDPKREAFFGLSKLKNKLGENRKYPFKHFTFPACVSCNTKYGKLEAEVKPILLNIIEDESVSSEEMSLFLDWVDKVRVGLWLGMQQLDKNYLDVDANFHIEKRIGQYDRVLIIQKTNSDNSRINFGAIDTPAFSFTPSVFTLSVNNFNFLSISFTYLLARRIGFPYPSEMVLSPDSDEQTVSFERSRKRIMRPLIKRAIQHNGVIVYQPQFRNGMCNGEGLEVYNCDYVQAHSLDYEFGDGNIFCERNGQLVEYEQGSTISSLKNLPLNDDYELSIKSIIEAHKWQNWLHTQLPDTKLLSQEQKKYIKDKFNFATRINNLWISELQKML